MNSSKHENKHRCFDHVELRAMIISIIQRLAGHDMVLDKIVRKKITC